MSRIVPIFCAVAAVLFGPYAHGQSFPNKPIRVVMSFSAGTGIDRVGRFVAQNLSEQLNNPVYVENKPGAGTVIGVDAVAKAEPDGYTLGLVANTVTINQTARKQLPYDLMKDFEFVTLLARATMVLAVYRDVPAQTLPELVALAKKNPGKLNYGTPGITVPHHLAMEMLKRAVGMDVVHVPHKGATDAINNLVNGTVQMEFIALQSALPHMHSGRIRALAVSSARRQALVPDIPTIAESVAPGFDVDLWYAVVAPAHTPQKIVDLFNREIHAVLALGDVQTILAHQGMVAAPSSPSELRSLVLADTAKWAKVIHAAGIPPQ